MNLIGRGLHGHMGYMATYTLHASCSSKGGSYPFACPSYLANEPSLAPSLPYNYYIPNSALLGIIRNSIGSGLFQLFLCYCGKPLSRNSRTLYSSDILLASGVPLNSTASNGFNSSPGVITQ